MCNAINTILTGRRQKKIWKRYTYFFIVVNIVAIFKQSQSHKNVARTFFIHLRLSCLQDALLPLCALVCISYKQGCSAT